MTPRQRAMLLALAWKDDGETYWRPMDLGGQDGSHHSATLAQLARKGMVDREPRDTLANVLSGYGKGSPRARSWLYRINGAGYEALRTGKVNLGAEPATE